MQQQRDVSEFNYGISFLNRLNYQFYICMSSAMSLDAFGWFHALLTIRRELSDDMKDGEMEESNSFMNTINLELGKLSKINKSNYIPQQLYDKLDGFEIFLRKIVKSAGYKTKFKDDPSMAMFG